MTTGVPILHSVTVINGFLSVYLVNYGRHSCGFRLYIAFRLPFTGAA